MEPVLSPSVSTPSRGSDGVPSPSTEAETRKRPSVSEDGLESRRKIQRVSRACDACKARKARCTGTNPCTACVGRGVACEYLTRYGRGRPPTPTPAPGLLAPPGPSPRTATAFPSGSPTAENGVTPAYSTTRNDHYAAPAIPQPVSRASPEVGMTDVQGQYCDPTSGLAFLHRAWNRLSSQNLRDVQLDDSTNAAAAHQPQVAAGDKPFHVAPESTYDIPVPNGEVAADLLAFYFDVCIATYRFLHRQTVEQWLERLLLNIQQGAPVYHTIGETRASIVLSALAIAIYHRGQSKRGTSPNEEAEATRRSDQLFSSALRMTDLATGYPNFESAQAKLIQVLYLLHTSRMNQAWYVFGNALQIISALGLHRHDGRTRTVKLKAPPDYIKLQCQKRTFWVAYILDQYIGVILGRPRHYHDEDIDQVFPDCVDDEDMTPEGPKPVSKNKDCSLASLVYHARISRIVSTISRETYTIHQLPRQALAASTQRITQELANWKASLPPLLGLISPSSLVAPFRRQATALRLAHSHAVMHANRPFLLRNIGARHDPHVCTEQIDACIQAAREALEIVDGIASDGTLFHAFWWTHYVTFCALAIVYIWEIQQVLPSPNTAQDRDQRQLFELAERCQTHLAEATATNSPSRRYSIILQELRDEAKQRTAGVALHALSTGPVGNGSNGAGFELESVTSGIVGRRQTGSIWTLW
ncbi:hypothetical protein GQ53DRAFT_765108 [Thozetella sp. PMI_491]|nr:hypothetical protein GQ53DRAFT_765108 [Thozetella sp. PMI_491]